MITKTEQIHSLNVYETACLKRLNRSAFSDMERLLIEKTTRMIPERYPQGLTQMQSGQIVHELSTIIKMGFPDYFLIVQDFLDVGRRVGHMPDDRIEYLKAHCKEMSIQEMNDYINEDQSYPGLTIGPGRGSAAGSVVAYLLRITNIDPFKHGLLFERFLNPERVSMPDIDSDFSKSEFEYGVRDIVIEYVTKKYGKNALCGITTPSTLAARAAVKNVGRIIGSKYALQASKKSESSKEAKDQADIIKKKYLRYVDEINKMIPQDPNIKFSSITDENRKVSLSDSLHKTFKEKPELLEILDLAVQVEGVNVNFGMHACGKIIFPGDIRDSAALMYDSKADFWKIQMDMEKAEELGYLKMDFLGLKNLNVITKAARLVYQHTGVYLDFDHLPDDPVIYKEVFAKGKTLEVFQFKSSGMRNMLKRFQPENFSDLILLVACYRPGPLQYLDGIIRRKNHQENQEDRESVLVKIPQIQEIIKPTYQAIVYQEQVQQIFRTLAGYSLGQADLIRRAMGHKKDEALVAEKGAFLFGDEKRGIRGCQANGVNVNDASVLFEEMKAFTKYAFNKSHAAAYAVIAYYTAYLKYYYPTEFYTAVLCFTDISQYPALIQEAKDFGVKVFGPDIEKSMTTFSGRDKEIYFGFTGIKGIGEELKNKELHCTTFPDFMMSASLSDSTITRLAEVGAFDRKAPRQALLRVLPDYFDEMKILRDKKKEIERYGAMIQELDAGIELDREKWKIKTKTIPTKEKLIQKIKKAEEKMESARQAIRDIKIPSETTFNNVDENLKKEKELLGMYASGHPLDVFGTPKERKCIPVSEMDLETKAIFGIVTDLRFTQTKKDSKPICFFKVEDQSGTVPVCCFSKAFQACDAIKLKEGDVVIIHGYARQDGRTVKQDGTENDSDQYQFYVSDWRDGIIWIRDKYKTCLVEMEGIECWDELKVHLQEYLTTCGGYPVKIHNCTTGEIEDTNFYATDAIWTNPYFAVTSY